LKGTLVGGLAGLLFGFDTAVIAGTTQGLKEAFQLDPGGLGMTVSSALWGTLVGALFAGRPGDRFGARDCLRAIAVLYLVSALGCLFATDLTVLIVARVLGGIAIGASSVLAPIYLAEIAPAKRRGMLVGAFQFNIVLGILVAYLSNYVIGLLELGPNEWRWKFGVAALPSLLLFGLLFVIPNSPRWLAVKGRRGEAEQVLREIGVGDVAGELERYVRGHVAAGSKLSWSRYRKPMLLAFAIAAFNQLSGINAILYYVNDIFAAAGFSKVSSDLQSVMIGATNLLFTLLALTVIDRVGRKKLLMVGSVGMVVALSATAWIQSSGQGQHLLLWALILFIAAFAFSQGAVIWVYISEIFPTEVRARGQSLGASTHWLMDAIVAGLFPLMAARSTGLPFVLFAIAMLVQLFVVARYFVETKGMRLEDIDV
jgi:sugar porter (SP) family MFS transporter